MNDFIKGLKIGTGMLVVLVIGGFMMYFGIKARSDSKTTTDTEPSKLYVNPGETLTATKRNTIADRNRVYDSGRFDVGTTAGAYGATKEGNALNVYTVNHNLGTTNLTVDVYYRTSASATSFDKASLYDQYSAGSRYCMGYHLSDITATSLNIKVRYSGCNVYYLDNAISGHTTGQYRVIARTF